MLSLRNLDVFYNDAQALWDLSLYVNEGEIVAILGSNGAGKTTTLRTISGLLKPRRGAIELGGIRTETVAPHTIVSHGVAHVPEGRKLFPQMTVLENLLVGAYHIKIWRKRMEAAERVYSIFPRLADRTKQLAGTLSGGEQQMVAIGRGLMSQPKLLMLDEPSLGLAPAVVESIFQTLLDINRLGMTILLIEQNVQMTFQVAKRGYVLETGHITLEGTVQELSSNEHVMKAYLGL